MGKGRAGGRAEHKAVGGRVDGATCQLARANCSRLSGMRGPAPLPHPKHPPGARDARLHCTSLCCADIFCWLPSARCRSGRSRSSCFLNPNLHNELSILASSAGCPLTAGAGEARRLVAAALVPGAARRRPHHPWGVLQPGVPPV